MENLFFKNSSRIKQISITPTQVGMNLREIIKMDERLSWKEVLQIRVKLHEKLIVKYGKMPSKKQYILEVIEDRDGSVSLQLLSKIMHYKICLLENWVLKLNAERKINIKGEYPDWVLMKRED